MFQSIAVLVFTIASICPDDMRRLATKAIVKVAGTTQARGISLEELASVFNLPTPIDGDVAEIAKADGLRVYGVTDFAHEGFEYFQINAFEEFPMSVAVIYAQGHQPSNRDSIFFPMGEELAFAALYKHPKLFEFIKSKGYFQFPPERHEAILKEGARLVHETYFRAEASDVAPRTWAQVRWELVTKEHDRRHPWIERGEMTGGKIPEGLSPKAREATVPSPPNREESKTAFGGWLPQDGYAKAALQYTLKGKDQGLKVFLNPLNKQPYDPAFPNLVERIGLEKRFRISWMKLENPVLIEIEGADDLRQMFLVFDGETNLPRGLPFYKIDLETGQRKTEKPTILARLPEPLLDAER